MSQSFSTAPNNQQVKVYAPTSAVQFKRKSEEMLNEISKKNAYKVNAVYNL